MQTHLLPPLVYCNSDRIVMRVAILAAGVPAAAVRLLRLERGHRRPVGAGAPRAGGRPALPRRRELRHRLLRLVESDLRRARCSTALCSRGGSGRSVSGCCGGSGVLQAAAGATQCVACVSRAEAGIQHSVAQEAVSAAMVQQLRPQHRRTACATGVASEPGSA